MERKATAKPQSNWSTTNTDSQKTWLREDTSYTGLLDLCCCKAFWEDLQICFNKWFLIYDDFFNARSPKDLFT